MPRLDATPQPRDQGHVDEFTRRMDAARTALNEAEAKIAPTASVRRLPTRVTLTCPKCQHSGVVEIFLDQVDKLRCSKCGHHAPTISGRSPLAGWSRKRRAGNAAPRRRGVSK